MATKMKKGGARIKAIVMPDDLWEDLRMQSFKEHRSASEIIRRLVADYLKKSKRKGR